MVITLLWLNVASLRHAQIADNQEAMRTEWEKYPSITPEEWELNHNLRDWLSISEEMKKLLSSSNFYPPKDSEIGIAWYWARQLGLKKRQEQIANYTRDHLGPRWRVTTDFLRRLDALIEDSTRALRNHEYEWSRYYAQLFVNDAYLTPNPEAHESNLNLAQKILDLTSNNFLHADREAVEYIILSILPKRGYYYRKDILIDQSLRSVAHDSVVDNIDYANIVATSYDSDIDKRISLWNKFVVANQSSEKIEEAEFNIISALLIKATKEKDGLSSRQEGINRCLEFARRYPSSYLADDAFDYAIRFARGLHDRQKSNKIIYDSARSIALFHKNGDKYRHLAYRLNSAHPSFGKLVIELLQEYESSTKIKDILEKRSKNTNLELISLILMLENKTDKPDETIANILSPLIEKTLGAT